MTSVFKKMIRNSIFIYLLINLLMIFLIIKSYTYVLGWAVGSFASMINFVTSYLFIDILSFKIKTKRRGFWLGILKTIFSLLIQAMIVISVISINTYFSNERIFWSGIKAIINPINFYTYLAGISLIPIATIALSLERKKEENG